MAAYAYRHKKVTAPQARRQRKRRASWKRGDFVPAGVFMSARIQARQGRHIMAGLK